MAAKYEDVSSKRTKYFQILGIKEDASKDEIRRAYLKNAMKCHPDKNPFDPKAKEKFQALNTAYQVLQDEEIQNMVESDSEDMEEQVPVFAVYTPEDLYYLVFKLKFMQTMYRRARAKYSRFYREMDEDSWSSDESVENFIHIEHNEDFCCPHKRERDKQVPSEDRWQEDKEFFDILRKKRQSQGLEEEEDIEEELKKYSSFKEWKKAETKKFRKKRKKATEVKPTAPKLPTKKEIEATIYRREREQQKIRVEILEKQKQEQLKEQRRQMKEAEKQKQLEEQKHQSNIEHAHQFFKTKTKEDKKRQNDDIAEFKQAKVKAELSDMDRQKLVEPVEKPAPAVNPLADVEQYEKSKPSCDIKQERNKTFESGLSKISAQKQALNTDLPDSSKDEFASGKVSPSGIDWNEVETFQNTSASSRTDQPNVADALELLRKKERNRNVLEHQEIQCLEASQRRQANFKQRENECSRSNSRNREKETQTTLSPEKQKPSSMDSKKEGLGKQLPKRSLSKQDILASNVWEQRMQKQTALSEITPQTEEDAQKMLAKALEQSQEDLAHVKASEEKSEEDVLKEVIEKSKNEKLPSEAEDWDKEIEEKKQNTGPHQNKFVTPGDNAMSSVSDWKSADTKKSYVNSKDVGSSHSSSELPKSQEIVRSQRAVNCSAPPRSTNYVRHESFRPSRGRGRSYPSQVSTNRTETSAVSSDSTQTPRVDTLQKASLLKEHKRTHSADSEEYWESETASQASEKRPQSSSSSSLSSGTTDNRGYTNTTTYQSRMHDSRGENDNRRNFRRGYGSNRNSNYSNMHQYTSDHRIDGNRDVCSSNEKSYYDSKSSNRRQQYSSQNRSNSKFEAGNKSYNDDSCQKQNSNCRYYSSSQRSNTGPLKEDSQYSRGSNRNDNYKGQYASNQIAEQKARSSGKKEKENEGSHQLTECPRDETAELEDKFLAADSKEVKKHLQETKNTNISCHSDVANLENSKNEAKTSDQPGSSTVTEANLSSDACSQNDDKSENSSDKAPQSDSEVTSTFAVFQQWCRLSQQLATQCPQMPFMIYMFQQMMSQNNSFQFMNMQPSVEALSGVEQQLADSVNSSSEAEKPNKDLIKAQLASLDPRKFPPPSQFLQFANPSVIQNQAVLAPASRNEDSHTDTASASSQVPAASTTPTSFRRPGVPFSQAAYRPLYQEFPYSGTASLTPVSESSSEHEPLSSSDQQPQQPPQHAQQYTYSMQHAYAYSRLNDDRMQLSTVPELNSMPYMNQQQFAYSTLPNGMLAHGSMDHNYTLRHQTAYAQTVLSHPEGMALHEKADFSAKNETSYTPPFENPPVSHAGQPYWYPQADQMNVTVNQSKPELFMASPLGGNAYSSVNNMIQLQNSAQNNFTGSQLQAFNCADTVVNIKGNLNPDAQPFHSNRQSNPVPPSQEAVLSETQRNIRLPSNQSRKQVRPQINLTKVTPSPGYRQPYQPGFYPNYGPPGAYPRHLQNMRGKGPRSQNPPNNFR